MRDPDGAAPRRHDLLVLHPGAWDRVVEESPGLSAIPELPGWVARGFPVMRRRGPPGTIAAAIALPGRRRVGFELTQGAIRAAARPPTLLAAIGAAPPAWRGTLHGLLAIGRLHGVAPRVFGSLMWQCVTGQDYLTDASDIDLLWPVGNDIALAKLLDEISELSARGEPPVDGEVVFPAGEAVQWRELLLAMRRRQDTVLAKSLDAAAIVRIDALLPALRAA